MAMKEKIKTQLAEAQALIKQLRDQGKSEEEIQKIVRGQGFLAPVLSKLFHTSGRKLGATASDEDKDLAAATIEERKTNLKPIREKEIEDAAWFHNLLHDLGKYVYHKLVQYVDWAPEDMESYDHARKTVTSYIDTLQQLIEDSGKIQRLQDEVEFSQIQLEKFEHVLNLTVARVKTLKWYNDLLISAMPPKVRLQALNQMIVAGAISIMPEGLAKAQTEMTPNA